MSDLIRRGDVIEVLMETIAPPTLTLNTLVMRINSLPSAEPVIHGRLIDADALSEKLCKTTIYIKDGEAFQRMINDAPTVSAEAVRDWIPCSERLPECEQEVLICTEKKLVGKDAYIDSIITPAIYEDGTMLEVESMWSWYDIDFDEWDDTEDCGIIPMGWFENRHFNPDEVYNNPVDRKVVAWMPLPTPYKGGDEE